MILMEFVRIVPKKFVRHDRRNAMRTSINVDLAVRQKRIIDAWMERNGYRVLSISTIEELVGLRDGIFPSSMKEIQSEAWAGTWPARWFRSGQTDNRLYKEAAHIYEAWWLSWNDSLYTYANAARLFSGGHFTDVGGTIFTAEQLMLGGASTVMIVNLFDSVHYEFAQWYMKKTPALANSTSFAGARLASKQARKRIMIFSGYFEIFENVDRMFARWADSPRMIVANEFCKLAYGRFIPILIDGRWHVQRRDADEAFESIVRQHGFQIQRIDYTRNPIMILRKIVA
jgi:hypothetical protein